MRRPGLVVNILREEIFMQNAERKHGLTVAEVEDWPEVLAGRGEGPLAPGSAVPFLTTQNAASLKEPGVLGTRMPEKCRVEE